MSAESLFGGAPPILDNPNATSPGGITLATLIIPGASGTFTGLRRFRSIDAPSFETLALWSRPPGADGPAGTLLASSSAWVGSGGAIGTSGWDRVVINVPAVAGQEYYATYTSDTFVSAIAASPFHTTSITSPGGQLVSPQDDAGLPRRNGSFNLTPSVVPFYPNGGVGNCYYIDALFEETPDCPVCPDCPTCPPAGDGFFINLTSPGFVAIVTGLAGCVFDALEQTPAGAPCRQCMLLPTQQIPWDNCGPCEEGCNGQVAFAIREVYGSDSFPTPASAKTWSKCGPRYTVARVVVSVTRCVPGMDENGNPPGCDAELLASIILENDRTAVRQGLACCLNAASRDTPALLSEWLISPSTTVGELGGCAGSETEFLVGVRTCLCPD